MLMYYDARMTSSLYCGMFDCRFRRPVSTYDAFLSFGHLYALGEQVKVEGAGDNLFVTAAKGVDGKAVLLANIGEAREISLDLSGEYFAYVVKNDARMERVEIDPASFAMEKETIVFFSEKEIEILA